jgi:hypothetical protein
MKPAPFDYHAPGTLREAIDLLVSNPEALVIAGGQSLMPVLAFRLATPSLLVDLRLLPGLGNIALGDDGVRLGALVRWRDIEDDRRLTAAHPLLHATPGIATKTRWSEIAQSCEPRAETWSYASISPTWSARRLRRRAVTEPFENTATLP